MALRVKCLRTWYSSSHHLPYFSKRKTWYNKKGCWSTVRMWKQELLFLVFEKFQIEMGSREGGGWIWIDKFVKSCWNLFDLEGVISSGSGGELKWGIIPGVCRQGSWWLWRRVVSWSFVCNGSSVSPFHFIKHGGSYNAGTLVVVRHVLVYHLHFLV